VVELLETGSVCGGLSTPTLKNRENRRGKFMRGALGFLILLMAASIVSGYSSQTVIFGNLASMVAVIGLFYTTINLKKINE
jgi:hypothetical protein